MTNKLVPLLPVLALALAAPLGACDRDEEPDSDGGVRADAGAPPPADDGGAPIPDGGAPPPTGCPVTPPEVAIRFDGCDALAACGGDPTGVWVYEDVCVADPVPDVSDVCATARVEDLEGTARGCVALDGANVGRDVSGRIRGTIVVPTSCTFGAGCAAIESALGTSCTESGGECRCPFEHTWASTGGDTYTVAGSVLTTGDGTQYDFCVSGGALDYRERGEDAEEPGVHRLGSR